MTKEQIHSLLHYENPLPHDQVLSIMVEDFMGFMAACYGEPDPIYEVLIQEHVIALAEYLKPYEKKTILEVGAGSGRLSKTLIAKGLSVIATDSYHWPIPKVHLVHKSPYREAVAFYRPEVVICQWMPYQQDWTRVFRATPSVQEYILIGESDGGCCGGPETFRERKGWERIDLEEPSKWQICRTDVPITHPIVGTPELLRHSHTVSFKRILPSPVYK